MKKLLLLALFVSVVLILYGICWGLPSRWCIDEPVARALGMLASKSIIPANDYFHPTFHYFILIIFFIPLLIFLKLFSYSFMLVKSAGSVSWIYLTVVDSKFPTFIYLAARASSVVFAVFSVYLAYKIAEKCYSKKSGIISAFFLSVTMGFISEAHRATSSIFLIFMVMATIYSCIYYFKKDKITKFIVPFFLGGLALATKYSGGITIFPLGYYLFKSLKQEGGPSFSFWKVLLNKKLYLAGVMFLTGFLLGFPGFLISFTEYFKTFNYYGTNYIPQSSASLIPLFISGFFGYLFILKDTFGIALGLFILAGFIFSMSKVKNNFALQIIFITVIPYYLFFSINPKPFEQKYIILIVPFLVILSSGIADYLLYSKRKIAFSLIFIIWIASFFYTLKCDEIYAFRDLRYSTTDWIENNIPKDAKIIIIGHPELVIHNELFKSYDITFLNAFGDPDSKYNKSFVKGKEYRLSEIDSANLLKIINSSHNFYIIYPVFISSDRIDIWKKQEGAYNYSIDLKRQKIIKEFSRKSCFFWNPNLGGYEPDKIIICKGIYD